LRKVPIVAGLALIIIGVSMTWISTSGVTPGLQPITLTSSRPNWVQVISTTAGSQLFVDYKTQRPGSQVHAVLVTEGNYQRFLKGERLRGNDYLAESQSGSGTLAGTAGKSGPYYAIFMTPTDVFTKTFEQSIRRAEGFAYNEVELHDGSSFVSEFQCNDTDDQVRAVLVNENWFNVFRDGGGIPEDQLILDQAGNSGTLEWDNAQGGKYFIVLMPIAGYWPVPYSLKETVTYLLPGSEWPLSLSYNVQERGPAWYPGLVMAVIGVGVLFFDLRKDPHHETAAVSQSMSSNMLRSQSKRQ
jgi:hypothetical protein